MFGLGGFLLAPPAIIAVVAIKILVTGYRIKSLFAYCGIDMIDVFKAEPARVSRMIYEKLIEKGNLLVYKNNNLKRRMKTAGINENADLSKKNDEIKQLFIDLQGFKEEVDWHGKMTRRYESVQ